MTTGPAEELSRVPQTVDARAHSLGRIPFAFGRRFFVGLIVGLVWLAPAWWSPRFIVAMFFWDGLLLAAWLWDFSRLPTPRQITVRRIWNTRPALGVTSHVGLQISADCRRTLQVRVIDEASLSLVSAPPEFVAHVPGGGSTLLSYPILPTQRGQAHVRPDLSAISIYPADCRATRGSRRKPGHSCAAKHRAGTQADP